MVDTANERARERERETKRQKRLALNEQRHTICQINNFAGTSNYIYYGKKREELSENRNPENKMRIMLLNGVCSFYYIASFTNEIFVIIQAQAKLLTM